MLAKLTFEVRADYLLVTGRGPSDIDTLRAVLTAIHKKADECARTRILIDARGVTIPRRQFDRFLAGELIAELFGARFRIAVIYPEAYINKFAENTAVNRGANLLVTSGEADALQWLMADARQRSAV